MNPKLKLHMKRYFDFLIPQFNHIEGDYVELGFGRGWTAEMIIKRMSEGKFRKRNVWLFDSFEGFPEPTKEDDGPRKPKKGQWKVPISRVFEIQSKYPDADLFPVRGFFEKTVPKQYDGDSIGILHLDCDLYESYKKGFELIDFVVSGGLIIFDEYEEYRWPGATIAINERFNREDLKVWASDSEHPKYYYIKP